MRIINVGLVNGRHEMPVNEYVFEEIENVLDFKSLTDRVREFMHNARKPNPYEKLEINLYVTGLTSAVAEVIAVCVEDGVNLNLMHYDRETGEYAKQAILANVRCRKCGE